MILIVIYKDFIAIFNYCVAAKKNEDGSYNVAGKVVFNKDITTPQRLI